MIINENGVAREATAEEIARIEGLATEDTPSLIDTIEAQVLYTALMTDTLLGEE